MDKTYQPYDKIMCRINIRPIFQGRKASLKALELNRQILLMQVLWLQDDEDNYPGEYALTPDDKNLRFKWSEENKVGWISSGDVEILESCHMEKVCSIEEISDVEVFDNGFIVIHKKNRKKALGIYIENMVKQGTKTLIINGDRFAFAAYNRLLNLTEIKQAVENMDGTDEMRIRWESNNEAMIAG